MIWDSDFKEGLLLCCCWYPQGQSSLFLYNKPPQTKWLETALLNHNSSSQKSGKGCWCIFFLTKKKKKIKNTVQVCSYLEVLGKNHFQDHPVTTDPTLCLWVWGPHSCWLSYNCFYLDVPSVSLISCPSQYSKFSALLLRNSVIRLGPPR